MRDFEYKFSRGEDDYLVTVKSNGSELRGSDDVYHIGWSHHDRKEFIMVHEPELDKIAEAFAAGIEQALKEQAQ